jgi:hypothetical protein
MKIALKVKFHDGTSEDVEAVFGDFVSFERTWNKSVTKFDTELRLTDLAWLAWHSLKRQKKTNLAFDPEFINAVELVEPVEQAPDPLDGTQPTTK